MLYGAAFKNKGVQPLLDAVVDYLPAPSDLPPVEAHRPDGSRISVKASEDEPFTALAFKIMNDSYVGQLTYLRVYSGRVESGSGGLQRHQGQARAHRAPAADARQQERGRARGGDRQTSPPRSGCG